MIPAIRRRLSLTPGIPVSLPDPRSPGAPPPATLPRAFVESARLEVELALPPRRVISLRGISTPSSRPIPIPRPPPLCNGFPISFRGRHSFGVSRPRSSPPLHIHIHPPHFYPSL